MEKIKACPLCGGYVHVDTGPTYFREHILFCEGCNMYFALDSYNATEDDLIKAFNARTEEAVKADEALKAQEPRVMTLEEVRTIPYGYVLIETDKADSLRWVDALLFCRNTNFSFDFITLEGRARLLGSEYGREWRCWTSRPTDEVRRTTPWG